VCVRMYVWCVCVLYTAPPPDPVPPVYEVVIDPSLCVRVFVCVLVFACACVCVCVFSRTSSSSRTP